MQDVRRRHCVLRDRPRWALVAARPRWAPVVVVVVLPVGRDARAPVAFALPVGRLSIASSFVVALLVGRDARAPMADRPRWATNFAHFAR